MQALSDMKDSICIGDAELTHGRVCHLLGKAEAFNEILNIEADDEE